MLTFIDSPLLMPWHRLLVVLEGMTFHEGADKELVLCFNNNCCRGN